MERPSTKLEASEGANAVFNDRTDTKTGIVNHSWPQRTSATG